MYKIMLIEDDPQLSKLIMENLKRYGYEVFLPQHFAHIEEEFLSIKLELVLLDINLPYYDGYFLCPTIKFP